MTRYNSENLLSGLAEDVKKIKKGALYFSTVEKNKMVYCPAKKKWSIVQVLEHMNAYCRFYLPRIEKELSILTKNSSPVFIPGFLGNLFTNSMKPKNVFEIKNKMKTSKKYTFPNSLNVEMVMQEFLDHQDHLLQLLELAKKRDLNTIRLPITITSLVKLKLGDVFRFLVAHEQRHMIQARNTLKAVGEPTDKFPVILQVAAQ